MKYQLTGWILFILCSGFFIASSLNNGDPLALIASLIFLAACVIFVIPLIEKLRKARLDNEP